MTKVRWSELSSIFAMLQSLLKSPHIMYPSLHNILAQKLPKSDKIQKKNLYNSTTNQILNTIFCRLNNKFSQKIKILFEIIYKGLFYKVVKILKILNNSNIKTTFSVEHSSRILVPNPKPGNFKVCYTFRYGN